MNVKYLMSALVSMLFAISFLFPMEAAATVDSYGEPEAAAASEPVSVEMPTETPIDTTETFTLKKGDTLWGIAMAQKLPRRDWPKFWKDACALSQIACTDEAWRKLPIGTVIVAPRDQDVVRELRLQQALRTLDAVTAIATRLIETDQQLQQAVSEIKEANATMAKEIAELRATLDRLTTGLIVLTLLVFGFIGWLLFRRNYCEVGKETAGSSSFNTTKDHINQPTGQHLPSPAPPLQHIEPTWPIERP